MSRVSKLSRTWLVSGGFTHVLVLGVAIAPWSPWSQDQPRAAASDVQVSIEQFNRYIEQWSEPEGYFDSDNFISNETSYLHVVDDLRTRVNPGGIYLGVGPDQNLSYIVHTRPMLAIITDIRRQNMLEHLWFKALMSLASNRTEYLALLVSREPPQVKAGASLQEILEAVRRSHTDEKLFLKNLSTVKRV